MSAAEADIVEHDRAADDPVRSGYWFWGVVIVAILAVEVAGAAREWLDEHIGVEVPWTTFSEMVGHLEDLWPGTATLVVAIIAPAAFYALGPIDPAPRSALGRVYFRLPPDRPRVRWYRLWFVFAVCVPLGVAACLLLDDDFARGYVIYGSLFAVGIVVPSILVLFWHKEVGFTSLFVTVRHLRGRRDWRSWAATTALSAGLAILVIHLAFYPWPDITKAPVKYAGLTSAEARSDAVQEVKRLSSGAAGRPVYSTQARGVVGNKDAWIVFFLAPDGSDSGCIVNVTEDSVDATDACGQ